MSVTGGRTFFCAFALSVLLLLFASLSAAGALVASAINFFGFATFGGFSAFAGFSFGGVADFAGFTGFGFAIRHFERSRRRRDCTRRRRVGAHSSLARNKNFEIFFSTRELLNSSSRIFHLWFPCSGRFSPFSADQWSGQHVSTPPHSCRCVLPLECHCPVSCARFLVCLFAISFECNRNERRNSRREHERDRSCVKERPIAIGGGGVGNRRTNSSAEIVIGRQSDSDRDGVQQQAARQRAERPY
jgi:hypothetical protein